MKERKGEVFVVTAGICWGIIGIFTRYLAADQINSAQITFIRNAVAAFGMGVVIWCSEKKRFRIHVKDLWMFLGSGILSIVFFNVCYFKAIEITTMSIAAILLYTAPSMVLVLSAILFKEKITVQKLLALLLAFGGCILTAGITGGIETPSLRGVVLGLGAGFGYALYSIFGSIALKKYHPFTVTFYTFFIAAITLFPFVQIKELGPIVMVENNRILCCLFLGLISTLVPFLLYTKGLEFLEAGKASVMAFVEPLVATVCGIIVFHEPMTGSNAAGIGLIFASVILLNMKKKDKRSSF